MNTLKKRDVGPSIISNRDPLKAYLEEAKKEINGVLDWMQKKEEIRTGQLEKLAKTINEMDNKAKGERNNLEEKLRHVEQKINLRINEATETTQHNVETLINTWNEGLFEWQYQLSMIVIFTKGFNNR